MRSCKIYLDNILKAVTVSCIRDVKVRKIMLGIIYRIDGNNAIVDVNFLKYRQGLFYSIISRVDFIGPF